MVVASLFNCYRSYICVQKFFALIILGVGSNLRFCSWCCCFFSGGDTDNMEGSWIESNGVRTQHVYNSSSNSNSSSISSISSSSSDKMTIDDGDLEADADSLSCRQSGLSSNDQLENDGPKLVLHLIEIHIINFYQPCIHA